MVFSVVRSRFYEKNGNQNSFAIGLITRNKDNYTVPVIDIVYLFRATFGLYGQTALVYTIGLGKCVIHSLRTLFRQAHIIFRRTGIFIGIPFNEDIDSGICFQIFSRVIDVNHLLIGNLR